MKRYLLVLLAACAASSASAQAPAPPPLAQDMSGPPPQSLYVNPDGRCPLARPGDIVHYALTIQGVQGAHRIFADLQMRPAKEPPFRPSGLPVPDAHSLGGGGFAQPDPGQPNVFQFAFTVPQEIYSGTYRGLDVAVTTDQAMPMSRRAEFIDVSHRTRKQVRGFCLNVVSLYGSHPHRPEVIEFEPGLIVPKQAPQ